MEPSLQKIKTAEPRFKNLVFGFVRDMESVLQFDIIPPLIYHLCLIFYGLDDYFKTFTKSLYDIDQDNHKIIKKSNDDGSVYGEFILKSNSNKMYEYKFKIIKKTYFMVIGIDDVDCEGVHDQFHWNINTVNYGFDSFGKLFVNGDWLNHATYGDKYGYNDIVTMVIDFKEMKIFFSINGTKYKKIAINATSVDFRMAVYLKGGQSAVQLLSTNVHAL